MATDEKNGRRKKAEHRGVYLIPPQPSQGRKSWRGKYQDPDTGRWVHVSLNMNKITNDKGRKKWMTDTAKWIAARRLANQAGGGVYRPTTIEEARGAMQGDIAGAVDGTGPER